MYYLHFIIKNFILFISLLFLISCNKSGLNEDFDNIPERMWIGKNYWAVPMEDWQVKNNRLESNGTRPEERVNILTFQLNGNGNLHLTLEAGLIKSGKDHGTAGLWLGMQDYTDNNIKSLCYFGRGVNLGVHTEGYIFIDTVHVQLPNDFYWSKFTMDVEAISTENNADLTFTVKDSTGVTVRVTQVLNKQLKGSVAILNNNFWVWNFKGGPSFWFDNLKMKGTLVRYEENNAFGPILWSMYTLSRGKLKMSVQMPPLGKADDQLVEFQIKKNDKWETLTSSPIDTTAFVSVFTFDKWDVAHDYFYRLVYQENVNGKKVPFYYEGKIRREPIDRELKIGGLTCQEHMGFPYRPLVENLANSNPDMLYFSGDQIYEQNGGYSIIRFPAERAIKNYLGKWYMFGWAFGDIMRDRPTVCIPDDHEVYQGNLWGNNGKNIPKQEWEKAMDCISGFVEPADMVNVVMKTNCSHLPDPFDPTPMEQNINVYYTDLLYGRVSFAICGDRMFKSGPENISWWEGRKDHIKEKLKDPSLLERPRLELLGQRQELFLNTWVKDWKGVDMKVLLTQTIFANATTHHGAEKMFLFGDMDSGGWPKKGRDRALRIIRKAFAFHICGDQHLPSMGQYGIDKQRDAGWVICTPAISVGYQRRFLPDTLGWSIVNRPKHNLPNTGEYADIFGNYFYVYAVGNPVDSAFDKNRYIQAHKRSSGFSLIEFNKIDRSILVDAIPFLSDPNNNNQFPGWPYKISQFDNYGREVVAWLPVMNIKGMENAVIEVTNETTNELEYIVRIKGNQYKPGVFSKGKFSIKIGDPDTDQWKILSSVNTLNASENKVVDIGF